MTLTVMTWIALVLLAGAPLVGVLAIITLSVYHEHRDPARLIRTRVQGRAPAIQLGSVLAPISGRRASAAILECYLEDARVATTAERISRHARLITPVVRASTWALADHLEARAGTAAPAAAPVKTPEAQRLGSNRTSRVTSALAHERTPRATRLMPLSPEIAIG